MALLPYYPDYAAGLDNIVRATSPQGYEDTKNTWLADRHKSNGGGGDGIGIFIQFEMSIPSIIVLCTC